MKKILVYVGIAFVSFIVLVIGIFFVLTYLEPMDENMQADIAASSNSITKKILKQKQIETDSLNTKVDKINSDLFFSNLVRDSLKEQIEFKDRLIDQYKKNIEKLNKDVIAANKITISIQELAKTYETMKTDEMRPILKNVNNKTVIAIYNNMNGRKRKDILNALSSERAALITQRLAEAGKR